ncbi:MAG: T9SS type A sorting domain-containing protein [candidate division Zixibacteria bacterium]|nr:T9SS type A sorting domain-containing protein [candidate division Zixibacteria bacterium]
MGIQNAGRDIGLQIAYDEEYLTDGLAITIYPPPAPQVVYFQDFAFNVGDWEGGWNFSNEFPYSPPFCLTDTPSGNYPFNANIEHYMIEDIDLNDYLGARLSMYLYHELEEDADFVYIYASNDGGNSWTVLDSITGDSLAWYQYTTNIDEFACGNLRLRFVLTSDWNNNFDGCYIDDLEVFGTMTDLVSPEVEFTGDLFARENTHYVGTALITDCSEIDTAASYVTFKINESGDWIEIPMAYDSGDEYSFTIDESNYVADDQIYLTITGVDMAGNETTSEEINFGVETSVYEDGEIPSVFSLSQNFPNPFNAQTSINYSIAERSDVTLEVYNILGQNTATLVNENQNAGTYTVNWDASNISSGIYFYKLTAGEREFTKRMSLLK